MPGPNSSPQPKPVKRSTLKARAKRQEAAVVQDVRARCVERDGECRLFRTIFMADCHGPSEWAHLHIHRRSKTRGQSSTQRHTTVGSVMLCRFHHLTYDLHQLQLEPLTSRYGADGVLRVTHHGASVLSVPPHVNDCQR